MNTSSPRVKAALISASALAAFGMMLPAHADKPAPGSVGFAAHNGDHVPPGQTANGKDDGNSGWQCDNNGGVGGGNPAHSGVCDSSYTDPNAGGSGGGSGGNGNNGNGPGSNNGGGSGPGGPVGPVGG